QLDLREHLEQAREHPRGDPLARVAHADEVIWTLDLRDDRDTPPPFSVYLAAFVRRFPKTCSSLVGSPSRVMGSGGTETVSSCPLSRTRAVTGSTARARTAARSTTSL